MRLEEQFTTPEQSKQLMKLGVPADSADCYYMAIGLDAEKYGYSDFPYFMTTNYVDKEHVIAGINTPCWSVGRLMEIYLTCANDYVCDGCCAKTPSLHFIKHDRDKLVSTLIDLMSEDDMDFSKLKN